MIYGITIILNDCNFSLKDSTKQIVERYSYNAFFTNKSTAINAFNSKLNKVKNEISLSYGKYELRGRCELYKATVNEGRIMEHGTVIKEIKF
jgi:hypothetical protein